MRQNRVKISAFLVAALLLLTLPAQADDHANYLYEQKIKAGIIYNFLKFTTWPESVFANTGGKLSVCLYGGDPFDGYLSPLEGKTAQQHPIAISKIYDIDKTAQCNLVFVHRSKEESLPEFLKSVKGKPVLTLSDIAGFARQGGMVEMAKENERISLYINESAAGAAGIGIAGNIMKLARRITTKKS